MNAESSIVLYDGVCGFCHSSVQFIIKRDPSKRFKFAPLQSEIGRSLAAKHGYDPDNIDGLILVEGDKAFWKSTAALRIAKGLSWPWPIFAAFLFVPRVLRDWFYDQFAKRRYRWFGKTESCAIPSNAQRDRFFVSPTREFTQ